MKLDAVELAVMNSRLAAIAEEMGVVLGQTAFSPNIKERRDFSCALFDSRGELVAQAAHIPVHLGSTALSVRAAIEQLKLAPGDVAMLNDPFAGGTHLPDVTVVAPIFLTKRHRPFAYVANRAHHADIGGMAPGSMALATEIYQEGFRLPPVRIVEGGRPSRDVMALFLANTRVRDEREGDLRAQLAALQVGAERLRALCESSGRLTVAAAMEALKDYAARMMAATLRTIRPGVYRASDRLDDDGFDSRAIEIEAAIRVSRGRAVVDFTGSARQVRGSVNANYAITLSATFYVMKCLAAEAVPANEGLMRPIKVIAPPGSIVNAEAPAAVAGGNVETSQRIVDVLFRALAKAEPDRIPAASSGSMSNLTVGGYDRFRNRHFSYYETIAGGAGAGPGHPGVAAIHTHMTNTLNTPIEALEAYYPVRITEYRIRTGSGGRGRFNGGDGVVRELECLTESNVSLLTERRKLQPYGLAGGGSGATGINYLVRQGRRVRLAGKCNVNLEPGDRIRIETSGGGAWGRLQGRLRSCPCGGQPAPAVARLGCRLRGVVQLQIHELRTRCRGRLLRARTPRQGRRSAAPGRLVGPRQDLELPHGPGVRAHGGRRGLAAQQSAGAGPGAALGLPGDIRCGGHAGPAREVGATHGLPRVPPQGEARRPYRHPHHRRSSPARLPALAAPAQGPMRHGRCSRRWRRPA
jgi:N-methylhydantoinase B